MYTIASYYASGATSELELGFLLSLVDRFSKPKKQLTWQKQWCRARNFVWLQVYKRL